MKERLNVLEGHHEPKMEEVAQIKVQLKKTADTEKLYNVSIIASDASKSNANNQSSGPKKI